MFLSHRQENIYTGSQARECLRRLLSGRNIGTVFKRGKSFSGCQAQVDILKRKKTDNLCRCSDDTIMRMRVVMAAS